jgi:hypothetical protein
MLSVLAASQKVLQKNGFIKYNEDSENYFWEMKE